MNAHKITSNDTGVSESIGFLLIFSMVIVGIGLVTLYGYPMLLQQQTGADEQIMEKNMIVLQNDMKGIVYKTVPYKETSLKIGGGSLFVNDCMDPSLPGPQFGVQYPTGTDIMTANPSGDLTYFSTASQTELSLQNGAVVKRELGRVANSGSVMLAEPRWFYDDTTGTMVINIMNISNTEPAHLPISRTGIGTVQMKLGATEYIQPVDIPGGAVTVIYNTGPTHDNRKAWQNYFERLGMTCTVGAQTVTCTKSGVNRLVVKKTQVIITSI